MTSGNRHRSILNLHGNNSVPIEPSPQNGTEPVYEQTKKSAAMAASTGGFNQFTLPETHHAYRLSGATDESARSIPILYLTDRFGEIAATCVAPGPFDAVERRRSAHRAEIRKLSVSGMRAARVAAIALADSRGHTSGQWSQMLGVLVCINDSVGHRDGGKHGQHPEHGRHHAPMVE
jgi:hypothetical protein